MTQLSLTYSQFTKSSQARGEQVARSIFPETTVVRPAPVFGFEDRLLHRLAGVTNVLTSNHMQERYWPVHVSPFPSPISISSPHTI
jgi:hypothetical protein